MEQKLDRQLTRLFFPSCAKNSLGTRLCEEDGFDTEDGNQEDGFDTEGGSEIGRVRHGRRWWRARWRVVRF